ncbi:MAG: rhodanese-like domain-containing protein [Thermodesulfobacteriota bacterium]
MTGKIGWGALLLFFCCIGTCFSAPILESQVQEGHIGSPELNEIFDLASLIDCRSRFEYDILRMKNAVQVPAATLVRGDLDWLRKRNPRKAIVFYCNADTCSRSLSVFGQAEKWGVRNIYLSRPGIREWAKEHPDKVLYFGKILGNDNEDLDRLFAPDQSQSNPLAPSKLVAASRQPGVLAVDIRDIVEGDQYTITLANLQHYPVDRLVKFIKSGSRKVVGKKIFSLDAEGCQSSWRQFLFADLQVPDYLFLKGGARAWQGQGLDEFGNSVHRAVK